MPAVNISRDKQRALEVPDMNACKPIIISMVLELCCQRFLKESLVDYFLNISRY